MHLLAIGLSNALGDHTLVKAADQLLDRLAFASFYSHSSVRLALTNREHTGPAQARRWRGVRPGLSRIVASRAAHPLYGKFGAAPCSQQSIGFRTPHTSIAEDTTGRKALDTPWGLCYTPLRCVGAYSSAG